MDLFFWRRKIPATYTCIDLKTVESSLTCYQIMQQKYRSVCKRGPYWVGIIHDKLLYCQMKTGLYLSHCISSLPYLQYEYEYERIF
tara:strand:- start:236 stop:493 length:258 start_codon:yes stop_codon:yes gene_type:complete